MSVLLGFLYYHIHSKYFGALILAINIDNIYFSLYHSLSHNYIKVYSRYFTILSFYRILYSSFIYRFTFVNLLIKYSHLQGGVALDIIPTKFNALFDIRLASSVNHEEFEATIKHWCEEAGPDVTYSFKQKKSEVENTKLDDSNPFWIAFRKICHEIGVKLDIYYGCSNNFFREVNIEQFFVWKFIV